MHRVNKDIVGQIPREYVVSLTRSIDASDELEILIPKFITNRATLKKSRYLLFDEVKNERFICIDGKEYFVIKEINDENNDKKTIKATSAEVKLNKISLTIENKGVQLYTEDEEAEIISLNKYMKEDTGWSLGNVDESIAYETIEGEKKEKVRWEENIESNWYDFLKKEIKDQFDCVVQFDTYNKKVNLYNVDSFGDDIQLILSHDNYIQSHEKVDNSHEIVTRLKMVGSEEMDIVGATVTGYSYLENYSYFLENGEMSEELTKALNKYNEMLEERDKVWKHLVETKNTILKELINKKNRFLYINANIKELENLIKIYDTNKDIINKEDTIDKVTKLIDERTILEVTIRESEREVKGLEDSILDLNILCKRETATNENGHLIFNEILLEELKEFIYCDIYNDESFLEVEDFVKAGKRKLSLSCIPTIEWSIDVVNFLSRIINTGFRKHWKGDLSLGDIIILYDSQDEKEEIIYFVGYTQNFKDKTLKLDLSNKKTKENDVRTIADYLTKSKHTLRALNKKSYLLNRQKYNRINVPESVVE